MKRALVVIDVQQEYFEGEYKVTYPAGSLDRIVRALEGAVRNSVPIVIVQHTSKKGSHFVRGTQGWELRSEVSGFASAHHIEKSFPGSFTGTDLEDWLRKNGIDTITICGYMTHMCCDTTSRQAYHRGFTVEFLSDATGTLDLVSPEGTVDAETVHKAFLAAQASQFSRVLRTEEWLKALNA